MFFFLKELPGPIDNSKIAVNKNGHITLKQGKQNNVISLIPA